MWPTTPHPVQVYGHPHFAASRHRGIASNSPSSSSSPLTHSLPPAFHIKPRPYHHHTPLGWSTTNARKIHTGQTNKQTPRHASPLSSSIYPSIHPSVRPSIPQTPLQETPSHTLDLPPPCNLTFLQCNTKERPALKKISNVARNPTATQHSTPQHSTTQHCREIYLFFLFLSFFLPFPLGLIVSHRIASPRIASAVMHVLRRL